MIPPSLTIISLRTADYYSLEEVVKDKTTVIDFWTTKCSDCPKGLDVLEGMARDSKYRGVQFVSICCDKLDGAREIIDKEEEPRWPNVHHYFVGCEGKEEAKRVLGFSVVPFYVAVDSMGVVVQKGKLGEFDFDDIVPAGYLDGRAVASGVEDVHAGQVERVFCLDSEF